MAQQKTDTSGQVVQPRMITHLGDGATPLTNRDIALDLQVLTDLKKGAQNADGMTPETANVLKALAVLQAFNGTDLDRWRNNLPETTLLASAARTTTTSSPVQTNYNHRGVIVMIDVTVIPGPGILSLRIRSSELGGNPNFLVGANISATGKAYYIVYPGITAAAEDITETQSVPLPRNWYVMVYHDSGDSLTYEVKAALIL